MVDASLAVPCGPKAVRLWDRFQFERLGYFVADIDSVFGPSDVSGDVSTPPPKLVFNQTVSLKEAADAKKVKAAAK